MIKNATSTLVVNVILFFSVMSMSVMLLALSIALQVIAPLAYDETK